VVLAPTGAQSGVSGTRFISNSTAPCHAVGSWLAKSRAWPSARSMMPGRSC